MDILIRNAVVIDPNSPYNRQQKDILIKDGIISRIDDSIHVTDCATVDVRGKSVTPGFCELMADFCDPGNEHREDIFSGVAAAAAGGYTAVCLLPDTNPILQSKTQVEYLYSKGKPLPVHILPYGAVSEDLKGYAPTEMLDMRHAGAIAFTDAPQPIHNDAVLLRALQYTQPIQATIVDVPYSRALTEAGQINEGIQSVLLGMKGISNLAEYIQVERDIRILEYTGGHLHLAGISTKESLNSIRKAKAAGLQLTASTYVHLLALNENTVKDFDTNLKVMPPLRHEEDVMALKAAIGDGTLDCFASQHIPWDLESKRLEFDLAAFGIIGLETAFGLANSMFHSTLTNEKIVELFSINPRKVLQMNPVCIHEGHKAELTFVDFTRDWVFSEKNILSKSKNTPFIGTRMKGKVLGIYNKSQLVWHERIS